MIPCKENKCILYPTCRHKQKVNCQALIEYLKYCKWIGRPIWLELKKWHSTTHVVYGLTEFKLT